MTRKILFVVTSHGKLGFSGLRTGVRMEDFTVPYQGFCNAQFCVVTASPAGGIVPVADDLEHGRNSSRRSRELEHTLSLADVDPLDFDAVFYPGGHGVLWDVASCRPNVRIVSSFFQRNCPVGAVGHGVAALLKGRCRDGSSVLSGRRVACRPHRQEQLSGVAETLPFQMERRLESCGARLAGEKECSGPGVCIDGNLVTAQCSRHLDGLMDAMLDLLTPMPLCRKK